MARLADQHPPPAAPDRSDWSEANQRYLLSWVAGIRRNVERSVGDKRQSAAPDGPSVAPVWEHPGTPPALDVICDIFRLSAFERDLLLLCAGVELDERLARLCDSAGGLSFQLGLAVLDRPHWDALAPSSALRYWRLLELGPGKTLTASVLRIDERILHYLLGVSNVDERVSQLGEFVEVAADLPDRHADLARQIAPTWREAGSYPLPAIQLVGGAAGDVRRIAAHAAHSIGSTLLALPACSLPAVPAELESFARLWQREANLSDLVLLIEMHAAAGGDSACRGRVEQLLARVPGALLIHAPRGLDSPQRVLVTLDVPAISRADQRRLWRTHLGGGERALEASLDRVVGQFRFTADQVRAVGARVAGQLAAGAGPHRSPAELLWEACRDQARFAIDDLAQPLEPRAGWDDLVVPDEVRRVLEEILIHVRQRARVHDDWGFAGKSRRGLGVSALFAGPSGTGKTMAAEVLARELGLDLYRIDLSAVISKYIGETEKNLRRVFDAAESGSAILLFDEADALFGKRSEVKDSHDRYANIEVSYLLQKMEAYEGLAILTSNQREALDHAFVRRIRFIADFPHPDAAQRERIWRAVFPERTPLGRLDWQRLARLNVTGGNIRNIALAASLLAADSGQVVEMRHLLWATRSEYRKLNKPLRPGEVEGWDDAPVSPSAETRRIEKGAEG